MFHLRSVTALALLMSGAAFAQPGRHGIGMAPGSPGGPGDFAFVRGEFGMAGKVVTGAPYSAQAVTQFTQTLADGNHIQRTTTASMSRDSQGRTRTERSLPAIGALAGSGTASKAVFINDPVAGMGYMLDAAHKTARQMPANRHRPPSGSIILARDGYAAAFSDQAAVQRQRQDRRSRHSGDGRIERARQAQDAYDSGRAGGQCAGHRDRQRNLVFAGPADGRDEQNQ